MCVVLPQGPEIMKLDYTAILREMEHVPVASSVYVFENVVVLALLFIYSLLIRLGLSHGMTKSNQILL